MLPDHLALHCSPAGFRRSQKPETPSHGSRAALTLRRRCALGVRQRAAAAHVLPPLLRAQHAPLLQLLLAPDGSLWVSEGYEGGAGSTRIARIDTTTLQVTEYTPQFSRNGTDGMTLLANGDLWFVEYADNAICKFSNGTFTEVVMPRSNVVPTNISSDSKGNLWITEQQGNAIARYTPSTGAWKEITIPTVNAQPSGICVDKSDNIWFTEYNGNKIGLIRAGTLAAADYAIPSPGAGADDIEVAPNGSIIFTEQNTSKVGKITVPGVSP